MFIYHWECEINFRISFQVLLQGIVEKHSKWSSNYQFVEKFRNIINYFGDFLVTWGMAQKGPKVSNRKI